METKCRKKRSRKSCKKSIISEKSDYNSNNESYESNNTSQKPEKETDNNESDGENPNKNNQDGLVKVQIQFNNASGENRCNHCREIFENPLLLLRHKRDAHSFPKKYLPLEEIEKYYDYPNRSFCPICKRVIKNNNYKSIFLKHLHTHTVVTVFELFECVICKKKFRRKDHMLNHQKRHIVPIEDFIGEKKEKS